MSTTYTRGFGNFGLVEHFKDITHQIQRHKHIPKDAFDEFMKQNENTPESTAHYQLKIIRACCQANNFTTFARTISFMTMDTEHLAYVCAICLEHDRLDFVRHLLVLDHLSDDHAATTTMSIFGPAPALFQHALGGYKRIPSVSELHLLLSHGVSLFACGFVRHDCLVTVYVGESAWTDVETAICDGLSRRNQTCRLPCDIEQLICSFAMSKSAGGCDPPPPHPPPKRDVNTHEYELSVLNACLHSKLPLKNAESWISRVLNNSAFIENHPWEQSQTLTWLTSAVSRKLWSVAAKLLPQLEVINAQSFMSPVDTHLRKTILHDGVRNRAHSFVEALLNRIDADLINVKDRNGNSALLTACEVGDAKLVEILLKYGADGNVTNKWNSTALIRACAAPMAVTDREVLAVCKTLCAFWRSRVNDDDVLGQRLNWVSEDVRLPREKTPLACALHRERHRTASFLRAQGAMGRKF